MRLIDADELKNELSDKNYITYTHEYGDAIPVEWVMSAIDNAPTVEERPTGKWKQISPAKIYECTNCGQTVMTGDIECYQFCHNCGADMRGNAVQIIELKEADNETD